MAAWGVLRLRFIEASLQEQTMTQLHLVGEAVVDVGEQPTFEALWLLYPKKVAKFDAKKAWNRLNPTDRLAAIIGLVDWRQIWLGRGELQFTPHCATWLNGHRWEDELPENWGASHASHVAAQIPETGARTVMPDHVKSLIAKLKGGKG